jgi:hypothetical protein
MTFINYRDRWFWIDNDIKYRKVISFITRECVSLKPLSGLYVNPYATSLVLYLTISLFLFYLWMHTHLNSTGEILGGVVITSVNTFLFLSELNSASIAYFHLFQTEYCLHSIMAFNCIWVGKEIFNNYGWEAWVTSVVLWSYTSIGLL